MKTRIILVLALVMGLVTTALFFNYMKKIDTVSKVNDELIKVVAAKKAIAKEQRITADMVELINVPKLGAHATAMKEINQVAGKIAVENIVPGEVVLQHNLTTEKTETMFVTRKIKEGYRAVAVSTNMVQSVNNMVEPEDEVDVISTEDQPKPFISNLILQKVRVLGVKRRLVETGPEAPYVEYSSIILELNQADTVKVVQADERGNITVALYPRVKEPAGK